MLLWPLTSSLVPDLEKIIGEDPIFLDVIEGKRRGGRAQLITFLNHLFSF